MGTIRAQTSCTLSTIIDVAAVYTYYHLASSTITVDEAPKDNINAPGASTITVVSGGQNYVWQLTEPTLNIVDDVIQTAVGQLYIIECTEFSNGTYDWGPLMTSSTYAAAKAAYNLSSQALSQASAANEATALLAGHFIYKKSTSQSGLTVPSANVVQTISKNGVDVTDDPTKWDYNVHIGANGIRLRNNENILSEWTGTALTFNNPITSNAQLIIGANGTLQSGNYSRGSNSKFASDGTKIDLINGDIITKYFRVSQGLEQGLTAGAYIYGTIEALDGKIGTDSTNYWEIGNSTDYNLNDTAKIIGHGSSYIQLGDLSTWRLATNRIHTGWYIDSDSVLHYPTIDSKYWDFGIHVPNSDSPVGRGSDKFLYIRTQNAANNSLQNLLYDIDDNYSSAQWEYKFWVDASGNVHAPGFYIGNSSTPIGGGAGTTAQKIINSDGSTYGKGSVTKPIYIDNSGYVQEINYTIAKSVPSDAKFTDTVTTVSVTGDGNAITTMSASNGAITATKESSFLLASTRGAANGVVPLNASSKIDSTYLPSYVDDVLEYSGTSSFPATGEAGKIYVDTSTNKTYRWGGSTYTEISQGSVVTISRSLTSGTKSATITIDGTSTDIYAPTNTNTTYTFTNGTNGFTVTPSGGSAQTVTVTPSITNNVTGSGTSGSLAKWNGTNTITDGPTLGTDATKFLNNKGEWAVPGGTYSLGVAEYNILGGVKPAYSSTGAVTLTTTAASNTTTPTIAAKTTTSGRYYAVETDKNGVLFVNVPWTNVNSSYLTGITSDDVTTALGFTPYNSTNPNGYTTNTGTVTSVRVQASSPLQSSTSTASSTTLDTTISFINQSVNKVLAGPSSGTTTAAPTFRSLVAADIPNLSWNKITSDKPTTLSGYGITDAAGLTAITGVEISNAQLTITRANGTSTTTDVTITASQATGATKLIDSQGNDASAGSATLPVFFTGGYPQAVTSIAKLNGATTTYPEFYAPTTAGTSGYVLKSNGSGAPTWIPQSDISSGNTYTTTIATDSGTNQLTLTHNTKYKLTAGGTSFIFTTPSDTDEKLKVATVTSGTTYYPIVGTGTTAATRQYDTTGFVYVGTNGTANESNGNALLTLGNNTASTTANWKKGTIRLYGTTAYYVDVVSGAPSANRTITLPNATGTIALTSDIPSVPTSAANNTTGITIADHGTTSVGSASNWSAGTASSWVFEEISIPNVTAAGSASSWTFEEKSIPNVTAVGSVPSLTITSTACDDITSWNAGSGSASLTFEINGNDQNQLDISFSHSHTSPSLSYTPRSVGSASNWSAGTTPTLGTAIKVQSKSGGSNGTAPTIGTVIKVQSKKSGSNSTVPSLTITSTTVVNSKSHSITDNGHTHTLS